MKLSRKIPNDTDLTEAPFLREKGSLIPKIPNQLLYICCAICVAFYLFSFSRHQLFQSNAYDIGIFDQWIWLLSQGLPVISSITKFHLLADHGAWALYLASPFYRLLPTINWLFFSQAFCLSFTAIPLWLLAKQSKLSNKNAWVVSIIWWLQPVVFNTNLFDFHPEVWAMPALVFVYIFIREDKFFPWLIFSLFVLGCRDGMVLIIGGIALENLIKRNIKWFLLNGGISTLWFLFLTYFLYPSLEKVSQGGISATTTNLESISQTLVNPLILASILDPLEIIVYLLLISIAFLPFWRKASIPTLYAWIPLVLLNLISDNPSFRTLIHHYNLPIALIGVVSVIDGLSINPDRKIPWYKLAWITICWVCLAKPYFFTGPYLKRTSDLKALNQSIAIVLPQSKLLTTSYLVPHLSHREYINFPRLGIDPSLYVDQVDTVLLNPLDPGWNSSSKAQLLILNQAKKKGWKCRQFNQGLELCTSLDNENIN